MNLRAFAVTGLIAGISLFGIYIIASALPQEIGTSMAADGTGLPRCPALERTLKRGSTGDDVKRLQTYLAQDPGTYPEGQVTGTFGPATEAAVKRWQIKFNIIPTSGMGGGDFGLV